MAALGKIRSWSAFLVIVIALGLFAFIAEELFRSLDAQKSEQGQQIGEVLGEKISCRIFRSLLMSILKS